MTWTATVATVSRAPSDKRRVRVIVSYTNDADAESRAHDVGSTDELQSVVAQQLAQYEAADALLANPPSGPITIPAAPDAASDPNAGLAPLTIEGLLGILSTESRAKLAVNPNADAIRRDVLAQDRASLGHWIAILAASPDTSNPDAVGVITTAEATMLTVALSARSTPVAPSSAP